MKVAIVTDWIYGGGGERVVAEIHKLYPDAPIYTSYCSDEWRTRLDNKVITGYLQKTPFRQLRKFLPVFRQWWFAGLDLSGFDLVISVTGNGEAKFAKAANGRHVCYCHTPVHFYWRKYDDYLENPGIRPQWLARLGLRLLVKRLRKRDFQAAQKVDVFIANSAHVQSDIKKFYEKDSSVIHPPVDTDRFLNTLSIEREGYVTMGRLVPYKRNDIIIKACSQLNLPLKVIGRGPDLPRLKKLAGPTIQFLTDVSDEQMPGELAGAKAFLFAAYEDFGVAPVEAMAAGTPVIAFRAGGALDYVIPGKTGEFFDDQTAESLIEALQRFDPSQFSADEVSKSADRFSPVNFTRRMETLLEEALDG